MRKQMARWLLPLILLQGCASGGAPRPAAGEPATFDAVNRALEGQPATVELKSGEVAREVEEVTMSAEATTWRDGDRPRTVPTAEVRRVIRKVRWREGKGFLLGLLAGVPVGFAVASGQSQSSSGSTALFNEKTVALVVTDLACGLLGLIVIRPLGLAPDHVVYDAAAPVRPAGSSAAIPGGNLRCHLMAARRVSAGSPSLECGPAPPAGE